MYELLIFASGAITLAIASCIPDAVSELRQSYKDYIEARKERLEAANALELLRETLAAYDKIAVTVSGSYTTEQRNEAANAAMSLRKKLTEELLDN